MSNLDNLLQVTPGGRAAKAGLVAGDYILTINGENSKLLKHLQAQQIIKRTTTVLTLHWCVARVRAIPRA